MAGLSFRGGSTQLLVGVAALIALIAAADSFAGSKASLGVFYVIPMVIGATVLPWPRLVLLALVCSCLRSLFDFPRPSGLEGVLRFLFATFAYVSSGLLVAALIRNREMNRGHEADIRQEQERRREAEEQLRILVDSSPAAVLTVDATGRVLAANAAANSLFLLPENGTMKGRSIGAYLPVLADALQFDPGPEGLRTAAQAQGRRENDEIFLANAWFSSYMTPEGRRLAAIVVDSSEEMRDREEESLRRFSEANRIAVSAVLHEVRNLSSAISVVSSNLKERHAVGDDEDFHALSSLAGGLARVAAVELNARGSAATLDTVDLRSVLDDLRIVIEQDWREIGGVVRWNLPPAGPFVIAMRHGLLQVFLNLAQNSRRAVEDAPQRELSVVVRAEDNGVIVRFVDSGVGVGAPERLFAPFQQGANGTGLGLYVSRAMLRSYGGDLRFEPRMSGSCFVVELQASEERI